MIPANNKDNKMLAPGNPITHMFVFRLLFITSRLWDWVVMISDISPVWSSHRKRGYPT